MATAQTVRSFGLWILCGFVTGGALGLTARSPRPAADALSSSRSEHFKVRLAATRLLARRADADSALRLHALLDDAHPLVRRMAEAGLARRDAASGICFPVADLAPR